MADFDPSPQTRLVEQLFVKHVATIRGFIEAFLPDFDRAEDVLQECFLTVAAKADAFRRPDRPTTRGPLSAHEDSDFLAWVMAIAKFKVLESYRQQSPHTRWLSPEVIDSLCAEAPADDPAGEDQVLLRECMEELAARAREVIDLRYGEGCQPAEIARRLGWTPESVYVALSRARTLLRACIERKNKQKEHGA